MKKILSFDSIGSYTQKKSILEEFNNICVTGGFFRRGKAYFRVVGDGVLQVLKFERESTRCVPCLSVGLFSMYGELQRQWFTSNGCIPRYNIVTLENHDSPQVMPSAKECTVYGTISPDAQLDVLKKKGLPWLNSITTQVQLVSQICALDVLRYKKVIWNDLEKYAPYLYSGDRTSAIKVIEAILEQHRFAIERSRSYLSPEEFDRYCLQSDEEDSGIRAKKVLAENGDISAIQSYLEANYKRNFDYAKFCLKNMGE